MATSPQTKTLAAANKKVQHAEPATSMAEKVLNDLLTRRQIREKSGAALGARNSQDRLAFTVRETAEKFGVSNKTVRRWISRGLFRTSKASRKILIDAKAVEMFMEVTS